MPVNHSPLEVLQQCYLAHPRAARWIIGFSGGLDSSALLLAASQVIPSEALLAVHINHGMQAQSHAWLTHCQQVCQRLNVNFYAQEVHLAHWSEDGARKARYAVFANLLNQNDILLLGHHANDQAETLLLNLLRGAGVKGLRGIPKERVFAAGHIIRPFLGIERSVIQHWVKQAQLQWVEDPSNEDVDYARNYIRHKIVDVLQHRWPDMIQQLCQASESMCEAYKVMQDMADIDLQQCQLCTEVISLDKLMILSPPRQKNVLMYWFDKFRCKIDSNKLNVIKQQFINSQNASPCLLLSKEYQLRRYRQFLFVLPVVSLHKRRNTALLNIELRAGHQVIAWGNGELVIQLEDRIDKRFILRTRLSNEKIRPVGRGHAISMKNLFQEAGVPPWWRDTWPILCDEESVLAVPGICVTENWPRNVKLLSNWYPDGLSVAPFFVSLHYHLLPS